MKYKIISKGKTYKEAIYNIIEYKTQIGDFSFLYKEVLTYFARVEDGLLVKLTDYEYDLNPECSSYIEEHSCFKIIENKKEEISSLQYKNLLSMRIKDTNINVFGAIEEDGKLE